MAHDSSESVSDDVKSDNLNNYDPKLDFFSTEFDPLKVLQVQGIKAPIPDAKIYDNLAKYESIYAGKVTEPKKKVDDVAGSSKIERRFELHQLPIKTMNRRNYSTKNVLYRMEAIEGPLKLLNQCKDDHKRIKIYTRHGYGMRGYITGFVTAFDKFWNISLEDVYEKWTRARRRKEPPFGDPATHDQLKSYETVTPPKVTVIIRDKKIETCERRVDQLLIRGEQIVLIIVLKE